MGYPNGLQYQELDLFFFFCDDSPAFTPPTIMMTPSTATQHPLPPGTVLLVDVQGNRDEKHAGGHEANDILLVPRPSEDPEDPLNWTFRRKILATSCVVVYTIMIAIPSSAVYSIVTPLRSATGLSLDDLNNGTGIMVCFALL